MPSSRYHGRVPVHVALLFLAFEVVVLSGGLVWTFRRAQLPVGVLGALGLACVVGVAQLALVAVVELAVHVTFGGHRTSVSGDYLVRASSVLIGALAVCAAAPLALKRFLRLDARWTGALSRELLAGFIASAFGALVIMGALVIVGLIVGGLLGWI